LTLLFFEVIWAIEKEGNMYKSKLFHCPNCGTDLNYNPAVAYLDYEEGHGISFCKECLSDPKGLDKERIEKNLLERGWREWDVALIIRAIEKLEGARQ
jgi:hypothetical protein